MHFPARVQQVLDRLEETRGLYYNVARPTASLLFFLARMLRPKEIVEVGTSNGYSALVLGAAVQPFGGRVLTIERNGRLVEEARRNVLDAGLQDVVTVSPGSAYKVLQRIAGPVEFVFLDATKQEYLGYFERLRPKLAPRALFAADNMLSHSEELRDFTHAVLQDEGLTGTIVPVGLGLLVSMVENISETEPTRDMAAMRELVANAAQRVFHGRAADVQSGAVFQQVSRKPEVVVPPPDRTLDGYEDALAEESLRLPEE